MHPCASLALALLASPLQKTDPAAFWSHIERLASEQKFRRAVDELDAHLIVARSKNDAADWARALIKDTQLRIALQGYETSVRFLREQAWPKEPFNHAMVELYFAHALVAYESAYGHEIAQREQIASNGPLDLKAWTRDDILAEVNRAYLAIWAQRESLGTVALTSVNSELLHLNDYPQGIRDTLRDAVTYFWVELLENTALWRPEHENGVYQLGVAKLLRVDSRGGDGGALRLDDRSVHPLIKIGALLDDLEGWHAKRGEVEAALEARLTRLRVLHGHFTDPKDRAAIQKSLLGQLPEDLKRPWGAAAAAQLAAFIVAEDAPDNLVRARAVAKTGAEAFPHSIGGERCRMIVSQIDAPSLTMTAMRSDAASRRSIAVMHKNVARIFFRAYAVDVIEQLTSWGSVGSQNGQVFYSHGSPQQRLTNELHVKELLRTAKPVASWIVDLPPTPDFEAHLTYVTPPLQDPGAYLVVASATEDFSQNWLPVSSVEILISDLVLAIRSDFRKGALFVEPLSASGGGALTSTRITLYGYDYKSGPYVVETQMSTRGEPVRFSSTARGRNVYFVVGERGRDRAYSDDEVLGSWRGSSAREGALIFTDRSIYRPLQKVHWKVVLYEGSHDKADYRPIPKRTQTVRLTDPDEQLIAEKTITTDAFGSASGEFIIPAGRLLGEWSLRAADDGRASVHVEEYKRPTFEVRLDDPEAPLRLNRAATLLGWARYYFGAPLASGKVRWKVTREPVYPDWWGYWDWVVPRDEAEVVAGGTAMLGADGSFRFAFTPAADERDAAEPSAGVTYRYLASVDVTDEGGETRSAERGFRLGAIAVEAQLHQATGFIRAGVAAAIDAKRQDLDGIGRAGRATYWITRLKQPDTTLLPADEPLKAAPLSTSRMLTEGDKLRPRWRQDYSPTQTLLGWPDGPVVARGELTHDASGDAQIFVPALDAGAYRVHYRTSDAFGATFETTHEILVGSDRVDLHLPALLVLEKGSVKVGETARLLVASGLDHQPMVLDISRNRALVKRSNLTSGGSTLVELPVREEDRGGFTVTLRVLRDHQWMDLTQNVVVPWDDRELKVNFATFRDRLRPGTTETFRITVRTPDGKSAAASSVQVLTYMYDRSLDLFGRHTPPDPRGLWPTFLGAARVVPTLRELPGQLVYAGTWRPSTYDWPTGDSLLFLESYGVAGFHHGYGDLDLGGRSLGIGGLGTRGTEGALRDALNSNAPGEKIAEAGLLKAPSNLESGPLEEQRANTAFAGYPRSPSARGQASVNPPLRANFAETAFFFPKLLTAADGAVTFEFEVPDSVTSWNVWAHALTRDLWAGSAHRETQTVRDLLVRPYLPRFLREGDQADLKVVVNDGSDHDLDGVATFDIVDPDCGRSLLAEFGLTPGEAKIPIHVKKGGAQSLTFRVTAPKRVGLVGVKVMGSAGADSDGESRPLPLLPSRMHLAQSKFVTLNDGDRRTMRFADLAKNDDPNRQNEQLVVTVDAQLFLGVLSALPYLLDYPYECTEQTLNRFVSTGILSSLFGGYPSLAKAATELSSRNAELETWSAADPNRKLALEETPWLQEASGGENDPAKLIKVLDPAVAGAQRTESLERLRKAQLVSGAFPWWPGGPPSSYMTLYIVYGFSKALEFGVDVPKEMVARAFNYLATVKHELWASRLSHPTDWEYLTFLNYVCTNFPDESWLGGAVNEAERRQMLAYSFAHWRQHSPYLKGLLALTLARMGRPDDAHLVFDSVMESSKTVKDLGTFWAPEDRSWLWFNDTIETQAFALRTLLEIKPGDRRKDGLILWLFLNKKLNHWKSTRATAEVLYSLAKVLSAEHSLGVREQATVRVGVKSTVLTFEPDRFTGKRQVVMPGPQVTPAAAEIEVAKTGKGFAFASATWQYSTDELPSEERGDFFSVSRHYFKRTLEGSRQVLTPLAEGARVAVGDEVEVQIALRTNHEAEYVHLRDPRGAGFEPANTTSRFRWDLGLGYYEEVRDSGENFFFEHLPVGEYTFRYRVRANMAGAFRVGPATVQSMYAPEFNAFSSGALMKIDAAN